jgi:hypothetical protein
VAKTVAAGARPPCLGRHSAYHGLVSLEPLHEQIARIAFGLPEAGHAAAGGGAMIAHDLVVRPTHDLDLFTPEPAEVAVFANALAATLQTNGAQVELDIAGQDLPD